MRIPFLAAICCALLSLGGCASTPAPKTYQLAPGVVVGQYSVESVSVELGSEITKDTINAAGAQAAAQVIAKRLENGLTFNYRNRMPVSLKIVIDEYVENISTAQLMLVGGNYKITGRAILTDADGQQAGTFKITPDGKYNSGGLLGVALEGTTATGSIRADLVERFVTTTVAELYPKPRS
jgi:hypothetical protein